MSRVFMFLATMLMMFFSAYSQPQEAFEIEAGYFFRDGVSSPTPFLRNCRTGTTDAERYHCTIDEMLKILEREFKCPWRDLEGDQTRVILRFMVNTEGEVERFLTLFSDNTANRAVEPFNNAMIRAVYTTSGRWVPLRESGRVMPGEFVLPVACNCSDQEKPTFSRLDTVPAYFANGHYQLDNFIQQNLVYPDGFLSRSGRQTTVLLNAKIDKTGKLDSASIRVVNLNTIDYRLAENAIKILIELGKRPWRPATVNGNPIDYSTDFKVTYVDDRNPQRSAVPTFWDIIVGNSHLYNEGVTLFNDRDYAGASELFKRSVFLDPDDRDSWLMLGKSYIGSRQNELAKPALQRAIDLGHPDGEKWMKEALKPADEKPVLPAREVRQRPERTQRVEPDRQLPPGAIRRPAGQRQQEGR